MRKYTFHLYDKILFRRLKDPLSESIYKGFKPFNVLPPSDHLLKRHLCLTVFYHKPEAGPQPMGLSWW